MRAASCEDNSVTYITQKVAEILRKN